MQREFDTVATARTVSVTVLIVGYNSEAALAKYLPGFAASMPADFEMILVDNDSDDRTIETFREVVPQGRVIQSGANLGFAKAVNLGAKEAVGEWLLLLNPDAGIAAADIELLRDSVADRSDCAAVGPIVDNGGRVIPAGRFPNPWRVFLHASALSGLGRFGRLFEGFFIRRGELGHGLRDVDWITGGCVLVRREAWTMTGGLTERWFMYAEDVEFCYRLKRAGYHVVLNQDIVASHGLGESSAGVNGKVSTVWLSNLFDFYSSDMARTNVERLVWKATVWAGFTLRSVLFSLMARLRGDTHYALEAQRFRVYASAVAPRARGSAPGPPNLGFDSPR